MNFIERIQMGLNTQIGTLFFGLSFFLIILGVIYWVLMLRKRKSDLNAYYHRSYYEKMDKTAPFRYIGAHQADFFGRRSVVAFEKLRFGLCLVPPPDLADLPIREAYGRFCRAIEARSIPLLAPAIWKNDDDLWAVVQGRLLRPDGRYLLNFKYYLQDNKLQPAEKERLLLEIARSLGKLHELHTETGEQLYHGFLIPSSLYLDVDEHKIIRDMALADAGVPFAIGPAKMLERLTLLRQGKLKMEKFKGLEILDQLQFFAPEQKDPKRLHEVGPSSDLYCFAALATHVFTQKKGGQVPAGWQKFLKACLDESPANRPRSFHELEDRLNDPELALMTPVLAENMEAEKEVEATPSMDILTKMKKLKESAADRAASTSLNEGIKACRASKWSVAKKLLLEAVKTEPKSAKAHAYLSIATYELGEMKLSQKHYEIAKELNPQEAKLFREHIALRV